MIKDSSELDERFAAARRVHQSGDLVTARRLYEDILDADADHAETLHALANILLRGGSVAEAENHARKAIARDRLGVGFHNTLGNVLAAQARNADALAAYQQELKIRPDFAVAHNQIGSLFLAERKLDLAIQHFQSAIHFAPEFAVAANNLGRALNNARRHDEAIEAFGHALRISPRMADAHANLGFVKFALRRMDEARASFSAALAADDTHAAAHRGLALLALADGKKSDAIAGFKQALERDPGDAASHQSLGGVYFSEGNVQKAVVHFRKALDARPHDADLLSDAAAAERAAGNDDVAMDLYRRALAEQPAHQSALAGFAQFIADQGDVKSAVARLAPAVNSGRAGPELLGTYAVLLGRLDRRREGIALLERALQKTLPPQTAMRLHFALAGLLDQDQSYDLAFFHCRRANDMSEARFDRSAFAEQIERIIEVSGAAQLARQPAGDTGGRRPVFVVGMPRAGQKVLGTLLSANPAVQYLGATTRLESGIRNLWDAVGSTWPEPAALDPTDIAHLAREFATIGTTDEIARPYFVDSTWRNHLYLGVIGRLFPGARIVECARDARDIALSCYFHGFAGSKGLLFSYELGDLAAFVNGYRRLMRHWRSLLAESIHIVEYEALVLDPATTCEKLAGFLDLPWQPEQFALGQPESGGGEGWRPYARAVRRYRHYRSNLESFVDALDAPPGEHV